MGFILPNSLKTNNYVVVDQIPKPDFAGLPELDLGDFVDMVAAGITYKNTYYILPHVTTNLRVNVAQWVELGADKFMLRYISEIQRVGYHYAPLEKMEYGFDEQFASRGKTIDVPKYVTYTL